MFRRLFAVAFVGSLFFALAPRASAHQETALYALAVIDEVSPPVAGLDIRVAQLTAPILFATNRTDEALIVHGEAGEPFLRLEGGRVYANRLSPTSYRSADPTRERPLPENLDPEAAPRWTLLARSSTWSWYDPRVQYVQGRHNDWTIPGTIGGRLLTISGGFEPMEGHGHFRTLLDSTPDVSGLDIRMFDGLVPGVFARNTTDEVLEVPGRQGEPFLRIGPRGVFGNTRSPDLYVSGSQTILRVPRHADPAAPPVWRKLSSEPVWSWLEYRARIPASAQQRISLGSESRSVLTWTTPMTLGDRRIEMSGHVQWFPPRAIAASESLFSRWARPAIVSLMVAGLSLSLLRLSRLRPATPQ